jgi:non-ribosomal peptide synthetase-like protein
MHSTIGDRAAVTEPLAPARPEISYGPFDPEIASEEFVFEPLRRWARETPDKAALVSAGVRLSYRELEARTNQVARALRARGVRRGDVVALVLPRGPEVLLAIVGVLKAGAAYVPLDAETPAERVRLCLEDSAPKVVIARETAGLVGGSRGPQIVPIDSLLKDADGLPSAPLPLDETCLKSSDLAYVIFTSGTTGRPKGVPISHRSLTNFVRGDQEACMRVSPEDRVFQGFSPASDGHHEEVWPTLLAGATLVVAATSDVHSGPELGTFLARHAVTVISCAPTLLSMVEQDVPSIRRILFGAERCPAEIVRRWWRPGREIINTYGPTEATVGATYALCAPDEPITIGRPLPNYFCYILDDEFRAVPQGKEGEFCISGIGVSRGYLGNGALTSEKFIPNPFARAELHNDLLYRTGDRARLREDGNIEWLGRVDSQVKIRGYRIELSDIESHILEDAAVRSVVVVLRNADTPSPQLTALLVPKTGSHVDAAACMTRLRRALPAYMVPQTLEEVDSLPMLPSGKIDRRSAQLLRGKPLEAAREVAPPRTDTERMLLQIWQQLFVGTTICRADDFFTDLGGYSLLATRFISILRSAHGLHTVSVRDIYAHPRLEDFAAFLDAQPCAASSQARAVPAFSPVPQARYALAAVLQGLGLLFLFGFKACFWLSPIVSAAYCTGLGYSPAASIAVGLLVHAVSIPVSLLIAVALKWIVVGKFRAGSYPIWGGYFVRWWFVQRAFELAPKDYIAGTPLAGVFLRMLGARVGPNVTLESLDLDCPDLIEIGADCVVESFAWIRTSHVAHGALTLRPIAIGRGCTIGVRSGVAGGAVLGEGAFLADLSCVREGTVVPAGEEWAGSPARRRDRQEAPPYDPAKQPSAGRRAWFGTLQILLLLLLPFIDMIPFGFTALLFYRLSGSLVAYLAAPAFSLFLIFAVCAQILLVKWVVLGRIEPGVYRTPSLFSLRKWFVDKLLDLHKETIMPIYDTLFTRPWCIALGMKCGPRTEIALPARLPYDLVELGEENFLASDNSIGMPLRRNGEIVLARTVTGRRVFLGNNSVIPQGSRMPDDSLLGALSVCPREEEMGTEPGQSWMGSPPFKMPRREHFDQFDIARTYRPTRRLYAERLVREAIRIVLPSIAVLLVAVGMINGFVFVWRASSLPIAILSTPLLYLLAVFAGCAVVFGLKKLLVGTYRPTVQPLWSRFVWNTETFSVFFHDFGASLFVSSLLGTPYMSLFLRFMGAKIGRRAFIDTSDLTEFDLISIGDDAAINFNAPLQAHLFEDRVMKVGRISIGDRCSVGNFSVVLFDSELQADSHVGHISLVMKGETIPSGTVWEGSPAQSQNNPDLRLRAH